MFFPAASFFDPALYVILFILSAIFIFMAILSGSILIIGNIDEVMEYKDWKDKHDGTGYIPVAYAEALNQAQLGYLLLGLALFLLFSGAYGLALLLTSCIIGGLIYVGYWLVKLWKVVWR